MIRPGKIEEAQILTNLSFESKRHWAYPEEYLDVWKHELTITSDYIKKNDVLVFESEGEVLGYYSIIALEKDIELAGIRIDKGYWLEHMFIAPEYIGRGIGSMMFDHLRKRCEMRGIRKLGILSDPNARGFYEKMGCNYQGEFPSSIAGRTTPFFILTSRANQVDM